jgi:hypothetical protein
LTGATICPRVYKTRKERGHRSGATSDGHPKGAGFARATICPRVYKKPKIFEVNSLINQNEIKMKIE